MSKFNTTATSSADPRHVVSDLTGETNVSGTERMLSVAAAAVLFGWGVYRRGFLGYAAMGAAYSLWKRGQTGHCNLYGALGINTANYRNRHVEERPTEPGMVSAVGR